MGWLIPSFLLAFVQTWDFHTTTTPTHHHTATGRWHYHLRGVESYTYIYILWLVKTTVKTAASCDSFPQRCRCQAVPVAPKGRRDHKALEPCPAKGATTLLPNGQAICPQPPSPMGHPEPKLLGLWIPGLPHVMKVHLDGNDDGKFTLPKIQELQNNRHCMVEHYPSATWFDFVQMHDSSEQKAHASWSLYRPWINVSRRNDVSITLVRQSASWAPEWAHLNEVPSDSKSLMALAANWVLNSVHWGGAVRVTRSYNDLQSVAATSSDRPWA